MDASDGSTDVVVATELPDEGECALLALEVGSTAQESPDSVQATWCRSAMAAEPALWDTLSVSGDA